jgi:hypothetical protein
LSPTSTDGVLKALSVMVSKLVTPSEVATGASRSSTDATSRSTSPEPVVWKVMDEALGISWKPKKW